MASQASSIFTSEEGVVFRLGARGTVGRSRARRSHLSRRLRATAVGRLESVISNLWDTLSLPTASAVHMGVLKFPGAVNQGGEGSLPETTQPPESALRPCALWK